MDKNYLSLAVPFLMIPVLILILWRIGLRRLKRYNSPILGKVEVYKKYNGETMLSINNYLQGVSTEKDSIKDSYWYKIADEAVNFCGKRKNPRVLMLGLGANSISSLIGRMNPDINQTIVEIDSRIIQACWEYFGLDNLPKYTLIQTDAYKLANKKSAFPHQFDVIVVDIYTGKPPFISLKSNQPGFIEKILPWLKKNGLILFNRPGHTTEARGDSKKLQQNLKKLFTSSQLFYIEDPRGIKNNVIAATGKR